MKKIFNIKKKEATYLLFAILVIAVSLIAFRDVLQNKVGEIFVILFVFAVMISLDLSLNIFLYKLRKSFFSFAKLSVLILLSSITLLFLFLVNNYAETIVLINLLILGLLVMLNFNKYQIIFFDLLLILISIIFIQNYILGALILMPIIISIDSTNIDSLKGIMNFKARKKSDKLAKQVQIEKEELTPKKKSTKAIPNKRKNIHNKSKRSKSTKRK